MKTSVANSLRCLCYPQAYLPLSYAAQIPITRNPDLANVRVSLSNLDQDDYVSVVCDFCAFMSKQLHLRDQRVVCAFLCVWVCLRDLG